MKKLLLFLLLISSSSMKAQRVMSIQKHDGSIIEIPINDIHRVLIKEKSDKDKIANPDFVGTWRSTLSLTEDLSGSQSQMSFVHFKADGTCTTYNWYEDEKEIEEGTWKVNGNLLTYSGEDGPSTMTITSITQNEIRLVYKGIFEIIFRRITQDEIDKYVPEISGEVSKMIGAWNRLALFILAFL